MLTTSDGWAAPMGHMALLPVTGAALRLGLPVGPLP